MGGSFEESGESVGSTVYMYKDDKWYNDLGALRKPFRHGFAIRNPSNGDIALMGGTQTTFWHRRWRDGRIHIEKRFVKFTNCKLLVEIVVNFCLELTRS